MPTVVDLFCGAGGLSCGFERAGFAVLAGCDVDRTFGETFVNNHDGARFFHGPVSQFRDGVLLRELDLRPGELDVLAGGPPCQAYSVYNHSRGMADPRSRLFEDYLRIVKDLKPKWLVMENVTGILSIEKGQLVERIKQAIRDIGYRQVEHFVLKAEKYGVPQERRRVVFIANRINQPVSEPAPTCRGADEFVNIWDAIGDLPPMHPDSRVDEAVPYACEPMTEFQLEMRGNRTLVRSHKSPRLGKINQERLKYIPEGGSWRNIPFDLLPAGMKKAKRSDHTKRYGRPKKTDLSCTILTKCDIHWGAYIHPIQNRPFSVREAARIQSFPDSFVFSGSMTEQFVQIGNAVPPRLAFALATHILPTLATESIAA
ncbi:DNA cytosine methyltransferase [Parerythrobacter aestuarii]|uniref:DNA cytosine methyltransferase n=1 Tax=Parerythrobacter aestuarii TaxID=3020909 RepID=UPI0024DECEA1|nr:DNA cytosine methyltransferase [Parerythrobacter aestuarii]